VAALPGRWPKVAWLSTAAGGVRRTAVVTVLPRSYDAAVDAGGLATRGRGALVRVALTTIAATALVVALYYVLPVQPLHGSPLLRTTVGIAAFVAVLAFEVRAISRHRDPVARAVRAMAIVIPFFIVDFAWIYLTLSWSHPDALGGTLTRTEALYFTVTVLSTVGFGDITPKTDVARIIVIIQMVLDLLVLGVVVRLIFDTARHRSGQVHADQGGESGGPPADQRP
jgi:voltage-gated potassium channel